jgi:hypothetical protein
VSPFVVVVVLFMGIMYYISRFMSIDIYLFYSPNALARVGAAAIAPRAFANERSGI